MVNSFDNKLPETTTYWIDDRIFFIKNDNFFVKEEEALAMAELLLYAMQETTTKGILLDNREASGVWPKQINELWQNESKFANQLQSKKIATLTKDHLSTMQVGRLSRVSDIHGTSRAFNSDFNEEVREFLLS